MNRLFVGNFAFEHELAGRAMIEGTAPARVRDAVRRLSAAWIAIAEPDDVILTSEPMAADEFSELADLGRPLPRFVLLQDASKIEGALVPWGWSQSMRKLADSRGWRSESPESDVVRRANSRQLRFDLEQSLGVALPGMQLITSLAGLEAAVAAAGGYRLGWILKANFGMAGRESIRGRGIVLSEPQINWARARLEQSGPIVFEPIVDPIAEAGIQLDVPRIGAPQLVGVAPQLIGPGGTYRGSRFGSCADEIVRWDEAVSVGLTVASRLQSGGYFGPLGIDAMWYRNDDGRPQLRPLQDLNARFTMGRLALGWSRWLPEGWCGSWLASRGKADTVGGDSCARPILWPGDASQVRIIPTWPRSWQGNGRWAMLILAASPELRASAERHLLEDG